MSGQTVHLPLACSLFIITRAQIDTVNRIIDLADGRDDLVAHPALREHRFQRVLVLALLPHDLIHAAEVQQDLKARFRLLHPIGAHLEIDVPDGVRHTLVAAAEAVLGPELAHQIFCVQKLQEVRCALLKDALVIVMLDRLGIGKQLLPMREQVARGVGVLLDLDDLGPVVHQVHTINGRAVLAEHLEHLLLKLHGLQILLERLLLFFQQRQHAQVLPRAAEMPADQTQQAANQLVHLLLAAEAVDACKLVDECKAVFCRNARPCGRGRMFCLLHALVSFAAAFDTCHKYAKLVKVCLL